MDITLLFARALKCYRKHPIILERWYVTCSQYTMKEFIEAAKKATMKKPDTMEEIQFLREFLVYQLNKNFVPKLQLAHIPKPLCVPN